MIWNFQLCFLQQTHPFATCPSAPQYGNRHRDSTTNRIPVKLSLQGGEYDLLVCKHVDVAVG